MPQAELANLSNLDIPLSSLMNVRIYEQSFEDGTSDLNTNNCTQEIETTEVFAGAYSLKVTVLAGETGYVETPTRDISPYQLVRFSFAHKENEYVDTLKLIVIWRRLAGTEIRRYELPVTPSTEWRIDDITLIAPKNSATMAIRIEITAKTNGDAVVYIDDIFMERIGITLRQDAKGNVMVSVQDVAVTVPVRIEDILKAYDATRDELKINTSPKREGLVQELSAYTIPANNKVEIEKTNLNGFSAIIIIVKATYNANATQGVRVRWLYSPDGTNYDTVEDAEDAMQYEDLTFEADKTRQKTILIPIFAPHVKIQIINKDTGYDVVVDVWSLLLR